MSTITRTPWQRWTDIQSKGTVHGYLSVGELRAFVKQLDSLQIPNEVAVETHAHVSDKAYVSRLSIHYMETSLLLGSATP